MAEKLPPRKRLRFRFTSSAGSSAGGEGGGGGDGDGAASPPHTPRRAPSSLPPRSPSPPKPFTYDSDARSRGDGGGGHNPVAGSSGGGGAAGQELSYSPPPLSPSSPGDEVPGEAGREPSYSPPSSDDEVRLCSSFIRVSWGFGALACSWVAALDFLGILCCVLIEGEGFLDWAGCRLILVSTCPQFDRWVLDFLGGTQKRMKWRIKKQCWFLKCRGIVCHGSTATSNGFLFRNAYPV